MANDKSNNANFIAGLEHNDTYRAKKVINYQVGPDGNAYSESPSDLQIRIATDSGTATTQYIGKAAPGVATSEAKWQIKKLNEATGTVITFADGDIEFDNIWDNRQSLSYS